MAEEYHFADGEKIHSFQTGVLDNHIYLFYFTHTSILAEKFPDEVCVKSANLRKKIKKTGDIYLLEKSEKYHLHIDRVGIVITFDPATGVRVRV